MCTHSGLTGDSSLVVGEMPQPLFMAFATRGTDATAASGQDATGAAGAEGAAAGGGEAGVAAGAAGAADATGAAGASVSVTSPFVSKNDTTATRKRKAPEEA